MATESSRSVDVFIEADDDGDKLVFRYKDGSKWFKIHCDSTGNLIITDNDGNETTIVTSAGTITPA